MSFTPIPKKKVNGILDRKGTTICAIVGEEHKSRFLDFCDKHDLGQTEMLKQMIDYCMKETN